MYSPIIDQILERLDIIEERLERALNLLEQLETKIDKYETNNCNRS